MTRRSRSMWVGVIGVVAVVLSCGTAGAADGRKVDQAAKQVERGAQEIGRGNVGSGFKQMFTGIGQTVVEGAKFTGNTLEEFFRKAFGK